jgi:16S rRNA (cytosine1402-N4)-methyltransferase
MRLGEEKGLSAAGRQHVAVMRDEVVRLVRASKPMLVVDATLGTGGHAEAMLEATSLNLLGLDRDAAALAQAAARLARFGDRVMLRQANFSEIDTVLDECGTPSASAIVADFGMSTFALDDPTRGFSFRFDGPLDMRMDQRQELRASDIVNEESEEELARIIFVYGEDRASRRIARALVEARRRRPLETTGDLRAVIEGVLGGHRQGKISPATRTFQALRIAVNHELESLAMFLEKAPKRLIAGGRIVTIAYHSLEDRPVKRAFRQLVQEGDFDAITHKAVRPERDEVIENPRARSARLRCIERRSA